SQSPADPLILVSERRGRRMQCLAASETKILPKFQNKLYQLPRQGHPQAKLKLFCSLAKLTAFEIHHMTKMDEDPWGMWLASNQALLSHVAFVVTLVICGMLITQITAPNPSGYSALPYLLSHMHGLEMLKAIQLGLGVTHFAVCVLGLVHYIKVAAPVKLFELYTLDQRQRQNVIRETRRAEFAPPLAHSPEGMRSTLKELNETQLRQTAAHHQLLQALKLRYDPRIYTLLLSPIISLYALLQNPYMYIVHLMMLFVKNPTSKAILKSLRIVGGGIASTLAIGIILVTMVAFFAYGHFYEQMNSAYMDATCPFSPQFHDGSVDAQYGWSSGTTCDTEELTLFQVVAVFIQSALTLSNLSQILDPGGQSMSPSFWRLSPPLESKDHNSYLGNLLILLFSLMWQTCLVNIITSLIIDSFLSIRLQQQESQAESLNMCFICGFDRVVLDDCRRCSFAEHTAAVHNPWHYMCYFMYVMEKSSSERTGLESYVHQQLSTNHVEFLPLSRSFDLEKEKHTQVEQLQLSRETLQSVIRQQERMEDMHRATENANQKLREDILEMKKALEKRDRVDELMHAAMEK
ncbi:hypothetical protein CYMTET_29261, partial [Cymbomonas tetramitiformis]